MQSTLSIAFKSLLLCFLLAGCAGSSGEGSQNTPPEEAPAVGGDADEHGCKASAGYHWSVVRNECIRAFEVGIRLAPQAEELDKTLSAFVVFKSDEEDLQAELYLPGQPRSMLLDRVADDGAGTWKNGAFILTQWRGMYTLNDANDKTLYQGNKE